MARRSALLLAALIACGPADPADTDTNTGTGTTAAPSSDTSDIPTPGFPDPGDSTDATAATDTGERLCLAVGEGSAAVPECSTLFCPPGEWPLTFANAAPDPGLEPVETLEPLRRYAHHGVNVFFDEALGDDRSDAALLANFVKLTVPVDFPRDLVADPPEGEGLDQFSGRLTITDRTQFESLAFESGRLRATWRGDLEQVTQLVYNSDDELCIRDGDIAGQCECFYRDLAVPVTLTLDLSIDG